MPSINHLYAFNLVDFSATQSFVNSGFAKKVASKPDEMDTQLLMSILLGTIHQADLIFRNCVVNGEMKTSQLN